MEYQATAGLSRSSPPAEELDGLTETLLIMWRRRLLVLAIVLVGTLASVIVSLRIAPTYVAVAQITVDPQPVRPGGNPLDQMRAKLGSDRASLFGAMEFIRSHTVAKAVIRNLSLDRDPEFNSALNRPDFKTRLVSDVREWVAEFLRPAPRPQARTADLAELKIIEALLSRIKVEPAGQSYIINVSAHTSDAAKSARIANAMVEAYVAEQVSSRTQASRRSSRWLKQQVDTLRKEVVQAENAIAAYQERQSITTRGQTSVTDHQIARTSDTLIRARAERTERQARLDEVRRLADSGQGMEAAAEIRNSQSIRRLRDQELRLTRQVAELSTRFGERHPRMIKLRAEISDMRRKIREEVDHIIEGLTNDVRLIAARESLLEKNLADLESKRQDMNRSELKIHQLERDAAATRKLYEELLARYGAATQAEAMEQNFAQILTPATVPLHPTATKKGVIIGAGFVLSLALGVAAALIAESMSRGFRSVDQMERLTDIATYGTVPRLRAEPRGGAVPAVVVQEPDSAFSEAIRSLRTALTVSNPDHPPRVLVVASSLPGEGKTSLAISLARQTATAVLSGRVILVDCDLRRPMVAPSMELPTKFGILDLFAGKAELDQVIQIDPLTGLHVLPALPGTPNPPELLNSRHMQMLIAQLAESYEAVIIDSPALSAAADARILAQYADTTVFVVRWETTPRHVVVQALRQLKSVGATVAGVVLKKMNTRRLTKYGYSEAA